MTYRELIKELLSKAREHIALAEDCVGICSRREERMHYRSACSYLIKAVETYNIVFCNDAEETVSDDDNIPDAPDYN
jgi:hypothetical protein